MVRALAIALALTAWAPPPAPTTFVTDDAHALSDATRARLEARLYRFEQSTGHQVLVYVTPSTGGVPIEDYAVRAFEAWKVGRKGIDDGLVLFVFPQDRQARIEVGYGLEDRVPDAIASRIIREQLAPSMKRGDADQGVSDSVDALLGAVGAEGGAPPPVRVPPAAIVAGALAVLAFIAYAIVNPAGAWRLFLLLVAFGRFNSRGRSGGGGGFSGGGGRSGGGGASGRW